MAWSLTLHLNNILPRDHHSGIMPRLLGAIDSSPRLSERQLLMPPAREITSQSRAHELLWRGTAPQKRNLTTLRHFAINQRVRFYRRIHSWRECIVSKIDTRTIYVSYNGCFYPTREARVRLQLGALSLPPDLVHKLHTDHLSLLQPYIHPRSLTLSSPAPLSPSNTTHVHAPILKLLNGLFTCFSASTPHPTSIFTGPATFHFHTANPYQSLISSDDIHVTIVESFAILATLLSSDRGAFDTKTKQELEFLLKDCVRPVFLSPSTDSSPSEIKHLKWIYSIKSSTHANKADRHRALLVSASQRSLLRHSVHGDAPTDFVFTVRILGDILPTWTFLKPPDDHLVIFCRDATKVYLQVTPAQPLIIYQPSPDFFHHYPHFSGHLCHALVRIYGGFESGLYWHRTFVPWPLNHFHGLHQSIYDHCLFYFPTSAMSKFLCPDNIPFCILKFQLPLKEEIAFCFKCRHREHLSTNLKGSDLSQNNRTLILSQQSYLDTLAPPHSPPPSFSDFTRPMHEK